MASPHDESLEREIRRILAELDISVFSVFPLVRYSLDNADPLGEDTPFFDLVRRCDAILLINSKATFWIDHQIFNLKFGLERKLGSHLHCAIIDGQPEARLKLSEEVSVFPAYSPTLKRDLQYWLATVTGWAGPPIGYAG